MFAGIYHLQDIRGLDPFESALAALPGPAAMALAAPFSVKVARRYGTRGTVTVALTLFALGDLVLSRTGAGSSTVATGVGFLLVGSGFGAVMVTATDVVVRHVPKEHAGVAGGLQQTAMNVGPALGVAAATALLVSAAPGGSVGGIAPVPLPATDLTLTVLAAVTAAGLLLVGGLPGKERPARTFRVRS
ncbi:MFS transporter [Streptomyces sp. NPDC079167]|uniref:MFS transporter n=1 Tax=Streptomyces sp. NPDC079167 TaxID=3154513 RepID=UPI0034440A37